MSGEKDNLVAWLESIPARDRARSLLQACVLDHNDSRFKDLIGGATVGRSEHARILAALLSPPKPLTLGRPPDRPGFRRMKYRRPNPNLKVYDESTDDWVDIPTERSGLSSKPPTGDRSVPVTPYDQLGQYLKNNPCGHEVWPHFIGPSYRLRGPMVNPFWPSVTETAPARPLRAAYLTTKEVRKVYNAMSYAMWKDGVVMNTHIIIVWSMVGLSEAEGDAILRDYLHKAQKFSEVGTKPRRRRVAKPREGGELRYVWVHENAPNRGFHSHVLLRLPRSAQKEFEMWSRKSLAAKAGKPFPWKAFRLARSYAKTEEGAVKRAWSWFRYLSKQLQPEAKIHWNDSEAGIQEAFARDVVKPWPIRKSPPLPLKTLADVSQNIGIGAQRKDQYVSSWGACQFDQLYSGHEMLEWQQRVEYERWRKERYELIETLPV
ncbi:hypothetical protein [Bradyrhizobium sp. AUGA SZCCT0160]|uniref:hypothetical protein n=1 Tax=Bradyrhizobium sp. AUGA SZCCT0160 TaxID=2807662 RepID=UPI001BA839FD|nr:hypothetical protein [Bradyrhizobium sp. AUGA SZCCT0160]MBR1191469.1 hypothetical protein [Bradyrhizobium sp. AUGA SZCCT0160]